MQNRGVQEAIYKPHGRDHDGLWGWSIRSWSLSNHNRGIFACHVDAVQYCPLLNGVSAKII